MPDQVIQFKATTPAKLSMIIVVLLALFASWFVVRWYVGNTIAEYFQPEENRLQTAQVAVSLAPSDPLPYWRLGNLIEEEGTPDQINQAVAAYEKAVSLSPNDYRYWMSLGEALEQAGDSTRAEKALREAVRLAPSYAYPHWILGNSLLRSGRYPEAFEELRRASTAHEEFRPQLFNVAWQVYKDDFDSLKSAIGTSAGERASFAGYLLKRGKYDEGLKVWDSLTETDKRANRASAEEMITSLVGAKFFHRAVRVWNEVAPGLNYQANIDRIVDPGFEHNITHGPGSVFGWQVQPVSQVQIGIDANLGHSGRRSLRLAFQVRSHLDGINIMQLVPVQPNTEYEVEYYLKSDGLQSAATPAVRILDAATEGHLVTSAAAPVGYTDWQRLTLSFKTSPTSEAILLKVIRDSCPENQICPIFGTVRYDDFDIKPRK